MKNRLFTADQKRFDEVSAKNIEIAKLESKLKEEQKRREEESNRKENKINELEKEVENFVRNYSDENDMLKQQLKDARANKGKDMSDFKKLTANKIDQITEQLESNME
jgi:predicted RNase H-like nuclease (RuvC/YqgF family)